MHCLSRKGMNGPGGDSEVGGSDSQAQRTPCLRDKAVSSASEAQVAAT